MKSVLQQGALALGLELSSDALDTLLFYCTELQKWNRRMNLIGPADSKRILESHFLDSLTLLPFLLRESHCHLLDIGTGAGFPGLVLHLSHPALTTTLVEPRQKRVAFLKHICRSSPSCTARIIKARIEEDDRDFSHTYGPFSHITSRAVSDIPTFLQLAAPLCSANTRVLCMKGPHAEEEITAWRSSGTSQLFTLEKIQPFTLPFSNSCRNIVVFRKRP